MWTVCCHRFYCLSRVVTKAFHRIRFKHLFEKFDFICCLCGLWRLILMFSLKHRNVLWKTIKAFFEYNTLSSMAERQFNIFGFFFTKLLLSVNIIILNNWRSTANPVTLRNVSNRMSDFRSASCSRLQIKYAHFLFLRWSILLNKINTVFGEKASNNHYIIIQCKQQSLQGNDQLTAWDLSILRIKDVRVLHSLLVFGKVPGCAGGTAFLRSSTQSAGGLWSMWPDRSPRSSQTSEKKTQQNTALKMLSWQHVEVVRLLVTLHLDCPRVSNQITRQLQRPEVWDIRNFLWRGTCVLVWPAKVPDSKEPWSKWKRGKPARICNNASKETGIDLVHTELECFSGQDWLWLRH